MIFSLPIGLAYFLDPDMYLQFTYAPSIKTAVEVSEDLTQTLALSACFQWGGKKD